MAEIMISPGMPRKVLRYAHELGVHNDCLVSEKPCEACERNIVAAFDHHYGHATTEAQILAEITSDFADDIREDQQHDR